MRQPIEHTGVIARKPAQNYWQQAAQNRILTVVMAMVLIIPLLAGPNNSAMQGVATQAQILMSALLAGMLVMRARVAVQKSDIAAFFATGANMAVVLYLCASTISFFLVSAEIRAQPTAYNLVFAALWRILTGVLLYFALAYHIRRSEHLVKLQDSIILISAALAVAGLATLASLATGAHVVLMGDHQLFGAFLMTLFPFTLMTAFTEKDLPRRLGGRISAILTWICLVLTGTRTSWIGAVAAMAVLVIVSFIRPPHSRRAPVAGLNYIIPFLLILSCGILFFAQSDAMQTVRARLDVDNTAASVAYRQRMWSAAEQIIRRRPIFGAGLGTFPLYQEQFSGSGRPGVVVGANGASLNEMAHNLWLQTAAEQGLIGVALLAAIVVTFLVAGLRRLRYMDAGIRRHMLQGSLAAVVGFAVDAIGNPAWEYGQVFMFFWLVLGVGVACLRPRKTAGE